MRATWMICALLLVGCGDSSKGGGGSGDSGSTGSGGDGSGGTESSSANGGTGGSQATSGGTGGDSSVTTGVVVTRSVGSTTDSGGTGGGFSAGGQGGENAGSEPIGGPCDSAADCASGLDCVDADSDTFQSDAEGTLSGPPNGICTAPCEANSECQALDTNAVCLEVSSSEAFCMPLCLPGDTVIDCSQRADMVCRLFGVEDSTAGGACASTTDCGAGQVCTAGVCSAVVPICSPNCAVDEHCPSGRTCDPLSGLCVDEEPAGADVGEACEEHADCKSGGCAEGICSRICTVGVSEACGEITDPLSAVCLPLYDVTTDLGDMGRCWTLCDCADECPNGTCIQFASAAYEEALGRAGFCGMLLDGDTELTTCN